MIRKTDLLPVSVPQLHGQCPLTITDYEYADKKGNAETSSTAGRIQDMLRYELPTQVRRDLEAEIIRELEPIEASLRGRLPEIIQTVLRRLISINNEEVGRACKDDETSPDVLEGDDKSHSPASAANNEHPLPIDSTVSHIFDNVEPFTWSQFPCEEFDWMINDAFGVVPQNKDPWTDNANTEPSDPSGSSCDSIGGSY